MAFVGCSRTRLACLEFKYSSFEVIIICQPHLHSLESMDTMRKRNNLTTSVTLLDELPFSDLFFADNEPGITFTFYIDDNTKTL